MKVSINGEQMTLPDGCTVSELLEMQGFAGSPCAVEVNRQLIPKRDHVQHQLADGDSIELVTLVGGG